MTDRRRTPWLVGLLIGASLPVLAGGGADRDALGPVERRPQREAADGPLRDAASVASLIERLDAVRRAGDVLPVHALNLALREAVERELNRGDSDPGRARAPRAQGAESVDIAHEDALKRDEAYRTPVASWVDPRDEPPPARRKRAASSDSGPGEADFERRLRAVVYELSQLDDVLDEAGLNARRDLLVQLLQVARQRRQSRELREAADD